MLGSHDGNACHPSAASWCPLLIPLKMVLGPAGPLHWTFLKNTFSDTTSFSGSKCSVFVKSTSSNHSLDDQHVIAIQSPSFFCWLLLSYCSPTPWSHDLSSLQPCSLSWQHNLRFPYISFSLDSGRLPRCLKITLFSDSVSSSRQGSSLEKLGSLFRKVLPQWSEGFVCFKLEQLDQFRYLKDKWISADTGIL